MKYEIEVEGGMMILSAYTDVIYLSVEEATELERDLHDAIQEAIDNGP